MAWNPQEQDLSHIVSVLQQTQTANTEVQQYIRQQLGLFENIPEYTNYLVFIFTQLQSEHDTVRRQAGLLLKNKINASYQSMVPEIQEYIKSKILLCVGDPSKDIKQTVSMIVTQIIMKSSLPHWPGLIETLLNHLTSADPNHVEGAFMCFLLLCEDSPHKLNSEAAGRPLDVLIPKLLSFFKHENEVYRHYAISCVNNFMTELPPALLTNMNDYLQGVFFLAEDPSPKVRRKVCGAFVLLVEMRHAILEPHIKQVIPFMLQATAEGDEAVRLEACEFWSALADQPFCTEVLSEFLPQLVPVLLHCMVHDEFDLATFAVEDENTTTPDDPNSIKPRFHNSKNRGDSGQQNDNVGDNPDDPEDDDSDDDDFDIDDFGDATAEWNLRKSAAAALDFLSTIFKENFLPVVLPVIQQALQDQKWEVRESAILALGAISGGCSHAMSDYLPNMISFFMTLLNDEKYLIRSITCWTLSRYAGWICAQEDTATYLGTVVGGMLQRILDTNKKVQEAACSGFATLEEEACTYLIPYLSEIVRTLVAAFGIYQVKNLLILYDAVGTLADAVGDALAEQQFLDSLMPPLILKWNSLEDNDRSLLPLLECLTSVATAMGTAFQPLANSVFQRCIKIIQNVLIQQAAAEQDDTIELPDKEFLVCSVDLISGLADGLETSIETLISESNLLQLLFECMKDQRPDVRQSAYALIGDLAKFCIAHLKPFLPNYLPLLIRDLTADNVSVCNNATWSIGEITMKIGQDITPFVPQILDALIPVQNRQQLNKNLLQNCAITLGRLGLMRPDLVGPHLDSFVQHWCYALRNIRDDIEKDSAFRGLCAMIAVNPGGIVRHFVFVCDAIVSWVQPKEDLKQMFANILHSFKGSMGENWTPYFQSFPQHVQLNLVSQYSL